MGKIKGMLGIPDRRVCPKCGGVGKKRNKVSVQIGFGPATSTTKFKQRVCQWVGHA